MCNGHGGHLNSDVGHLWGSRGRDASTNCTARMVLEENGGGARMEATCASQGEGIGQGKRSSGGSSRRGETKGLHLGCRDRRGKEDRKMCGAGKEEGAG